MSAYALMHDPIRITITPSGAKAGVVNSHAGSAEPELAASMLVYFQPRISASPIIILRLSESIQWPSCSAVVCHGEAGFMDAVYIFMSLSEKICMCLYSCVLEFIEQIFPVLLVRQMQALLQKSFNYAQTCFNVDRDKTRLDTWCGGNTFYLISLFY